MKSDIGFEQALSAIKIIKNMVGHGVPEKAT